MRALEAVRWPIDWSESESSSGQAALGSVDEQQDELVRRTVVVLLVDGGGTAGLCGRRLRRPHYVELALDGRAATHLDRYVVTSSLVQLPGPNLLSDEPTPSMDKGYFVVIAPLSRGKHTVRAYDEFAVADFAAGVTMNITVVNGHH